LFETSAGAISRQDAVLLIREPGFWTLVPIISSIGMSIIIYIISLESTRWFGIAQVLKIRFTLAANAIVLVDILTNNGERLRNMLGGFDTQ